MGTSIRLQETESMYWLESAKPTDVPPLFGHYTGTTACIAAIAVNGALTLAHMEALAPDMAGLRADLSRLCKHGVLSHYNVPVMKKNPGVYYLNRSHDGYNHFFWLGTQIWEVCVKPKLRKPISTPFLRVVSNYHPANGAEHLWRGNYAGRVLHLLGQTSSEFTTPVISDFLGDVEYKNIRHKVLDRLEAFGLLTSRIEQGGRLFKYNDEHPYGPALRRYIRWLNRTHFPQYISLARSQDNRLKTGYYETDGQRRKTLRQMIRATQPSYQRSHGKKIKESQTKPSRRNDDLD